MQENALFQSVKCWSGGQRISSQPREADEQLLALIEEIRLENIPSSQLNAILDDNWMQQVTALLYDSDVLTVVPSTHTARMLLSLQDGDRLWHQRGAFGSSAFQQSYADASLLLKNG